MSDELSASSTGAPLLRKVVLLLMGPHDVHLAYLKWFQVYFGFILLLYPKGPALQNLRGRIVIQGDRQRGVATIAVANCPNLKGKNGTGAGFNDFAHECFAPILLELARERHISWESDRVDVLPLLLAEQSLSSESNSWSGMIFMHSDFWFSPKKIEEWSLDVRKLWRLHKGLVSGGMTLQHRCLRGEALDADNTETLGWNWIASEKEQALQLIQLAKRAGGALDEIAKDWPPDELCYGWSDFTYIPRSVWASFGSLMTWLQPVRLELAMPTVQSILVRAGLGEEELHCAGCCSCDIEDARALEVHVCGHRMNFLDPRTRTVIDRELDPKNPGQRGSLNPFRKPAIVDMTRLAARRNGRSWNNGQPLKLYALYATVDAPSTTSGNKLLLGSVPDRVSIEEITEHWLEMSLSDVTRANGVESVHEFLLALQMIAHDRPVLSAAIESVTYSVQISIRGSFRQQELQVCPSFFGFPTKMSLDEVACLLKQIAELAPRSWAMFQKKLSTPEGAALLDDLAFSKSVEVLSWKSPTSPGKLELYPVDFALPHGFAPKRDPAFMKVALPVVPLEVIWHMQWLFIILQIIGQTPDIAASFGQHGGEWWLLDSERKGPTAFAGWNIVEVGPGIPIMSLLTQALLPDIGSYTLVDLYPVLHIQYWFMKVAGCLDKTVFVPNEMGSGRLLPEYDLFIALRSFGRMASTARFHVFENFIRRSRRGVIWEEVKNAHSVMYGKEMQAAERDNWNAMKGLFVGDDLIYRLEQAGFDAVRLPVNEVLSCPVIAQRAAHDHADSFVVFARKNLA